MSQTTDYITVDDGPSDDFAGKIDFLRRRTVPAVFFCTGERLLGRRDAVIAAIRGNFLVANRSFSTRASRR